MAAAAKVGSTRNFRVRFVVALLAEVIYLGVRTVFISSVESDFLLEVIRTGWRLLFIGIYVWLFFDLVTNRVDRRPLPRHPLILGAMSLVLLMGPFVFDGSPFNWQFMALDVIAIPVVALREELFYRAILQTALERLGSPAAALLIASILFVLSHVGAQPMNLATISSLLAFGVVCGVLYQHTRNLWIVVIFHAIADFLVWLPYSTPIQPSIGFVGNLAALIGAFIWWAHSRPGGQDKHGLAA